MVRKHDCSFWLGGFQDLEADKHLSWSWTPLMFDDDDLDAELEPMQTCHAGYLEVTHRDTFSSLDELFPISYLLVLLLHSRFLLSGIRWKILMFLAGCLLFLRDRPCLCILCTHNSTHCHPCAKSTPYRGCDWASF